MGNVAIGAAEDVESPGADEESLEHQDCGRETDGDAETKGEAHHDD